jgi:hypothetical protein
MRRRVKFVAVPIDLGPPTDQVFLLLFGTGLRFNSALTNVSTSVDGCCRRCSMPGPRVPSQDWTRSM